ncbi:Adenine-specific DNA methylase containing a Zn-ribbon-like protein [Nitrosococcus oceani ATCC 19707]|uniref:Adenine-specific DNA methylase containing a Zn-ribbon-like protein n=3 Tax=Nitrosococcus oceani TaxID=1229 RepID=Q3J940_NITOC|nr:Adenine-specific DNA methylase containing a Zn-ribbon-like protein [Nitrosococcus oceani ATCC 19707]KFI18956.1 DNA methylase [Nitrosococcus oceani C-27]GEM19776.1 DNA methylase [Nitrosococcus oceani]
MTIETKFNIPLVASLALREKQIQQNYRPIIAVHKWFARRPGSLFRALALAEFGEAPLADLYFTANNFPGRQVADPFMGGGTPLIEANRIGCDVTGFDINPMAAWIVREEIEHLDITVYQEEASRFLHKLRHEIGPLYVTDCSLYGDTDVPVKYFLWVKVISCESCGQEVDLFPGYVLSQNARHPKNVMVCADCGELSEVNDRAVPGVCKSCDATLHAKGPAGRGRCVCAHCDHENRYPRASQGPLQHRLFAIEYYNPHRKAQHKGRFFKKPDAKDLARVAEAKQRWHEFHAHFVPEQKILSGDETDRLHRWGYSHYREMFNHRQLLGLELSCRLIARVKNERVRHALATNLSDLLRYQNMLCRYDTWALKSLDIFSVHGFPVGLIQCESNLLGIINNKGTNVGSGGWTNIIDKYTKAKRYCDTPFEVQRHGTRNVQIPIQGEWIGEKLNGEQRRNVAIHCADATTVKLAPNSLDAVFTDPPYFGNVQYGELMDFCYVWLRRLVGNEAEGFWRPSTRTDGELTGNVTRSWGLPRFTEGLARVYRHMAEALQPGAPLAFTYHHNKLNAYFAVGVAILDAGLTCSASLPCPAEMGGSIHIHGTTSSIIDTVFVCRDTGHVPRRWLFESTDQLAAIVAHDLAQVAEGGHKPSMGDTRCIIFGHLTRMAIWNLRLTWEAKLSTDEKLDRFAKAVRALADPDDLLERLQADGRVSAPAEPLFSAATTLGRIRDAVSFRSSLCRDRKRSRHLCR